MFCSLPFEDGWMLIFSFEGIILVIDASDKKQQRVDLLLESNCTYALFRKRQNRRGQYYQYPKHGVQTLMSNI